MSRPLRDLDTEAADDRTLRLAAPVVTPELLEGYAKYLEILRDLLGATSIRGAGDSDFVAECHRRAREQSGVRPECFGALSALVADFAARRGTVLALKARLAQVTDPELQEKIRKELLRLDSVAPLERRYGVEAIALLMSREQALVALQSEVSRALAGR